VSGGQARRRIGTGINESVERMETCIIQRKCVILLVFAALLMGRRTTGKEAEYVHSEHYQAKLRLMKRGIRDLDPAAVVDQGYDVLMRIPGDPETLRWTGLALAHLGVEQLALHMLRTCSQVIDDERVVDAIDKLSGSRASLTIDYVDPPEGWFDFYRPSYVPLHPEGSDAYRSHPTFLALPGDARGALVRQVRDIEALGLPKRSPIVSDHGSFVRVAYEDLPVTESQGPISLHHDLSTYGYVDAIIEARLEAGTTTAIQVACVRAAMMGFAGLARDDEVRLDGAAIEIPDGASLLPVAPGEYDLRVRRGDFSVQRSVQLDPGVEMRFEMPSILIIDNKVDEFDMKIEGAHSEWTVDGPENIVAFDPERELRIEVSGQQYEAFSTNVQGSVGEEVTVSLDRSMLTMRAEWREYWRAKRLRTWGWTLAALSSTAAVAAGLTGGLSLYHTSQASDDYSAYNAAVDALKARARRNDVMHHDYRARTYAWTAAATGTAAAGLLAGSLHLLLRTKSTSPPDDTAPPRSVLWIGPGIDSGHGIGLTISFGTPAGRAP
jgi:hypothetical protein